MDKIDFVVTDNGSKKEERSMKTWKKTVMLRTKRILQMTTLKVMLPTISQTIILVMIRRLKMSMIKEKLTNKNWKKRKYFKTKP